MLYKRKIVTNSSRTLISQQAQVSQYHIQLFHFMSTPIPHTQTEQGAWENSRCLRQCYNMLAETDTLDHDPLNCMLSPAINVPLICYPSQSGFLALYNIVPNAGERHLWLPLTKISLKALKYNFSNLLYLFLHPMRLIENYKQVTFITPFHATYLRGIPGTEPWSALRVTPTDQWFI